MKCPECEGIGEFDERDRCFMCGGEGVISFRQHIGNFLWNHTISRYWAWQHRQEWDRKHGGGGLAVRKCFDNCPVWKGKGCPGNSMECGLTSDYQRIIDAMIRGVVPEDAISIVLLSIDSSEFSIDDAEERENGDKFITVWYRQERKEGEDGY